MNQLTWEVRMLKRYQSFTGAFLRITDVIWIAVAWLASYYVRFYVPLIKVTKGFPEFRTYSALTPLVVFLWLIVLTASRVYEPEKILRRTTEVLRVVRAHFFAMLIFLCLTYLFSEYKYSRVVMTYFGVIGTVLLVGSRLVLRNSLRFYHRRGNGNRKVLAVGVGRSLEEILWRINRFPEVGVSLIGRVGPDASKELKHQYLLTHLGTYSQLVSVIRQFQPHEILVALPRDQATEQERLLNDIRDETVDIHLVPDLHEYVLFGCEVTDFNGVPTIALNESPLEGWNAVIKRVTDFFASGLALLVLSPILLFIAILVKMTSKGPIFYAQERMGLDGRVFTMYKFRSMRVDAEASTGAVWATAGDTRRTWLGSFLRATSLDELPQFWNVFRGDMSLVGPRPERPLFVDKFKHEIPHYMLRHKVKSGITGWAQVNGWRGNTSLEKRIECDLYYIKNWSYILDVKILFLTLWKGFVNRNAY